jgi:16S rRNA processing protein RimM
MISRAMAGDPSGQAGPVAPGVVLGRIAGPFGVKGWVKVKSYTEPVEGILGYRDWHVSVPGAGPRTLRPIEGRRHGKLVVARLDGVDDRDAAAELVHCEISVPRGDLPPTGERQHYMADLEGLEVLTIDGQVLGRLDHFVETGANPVMVVIGERERWLPLVPHCLKGVDLAAGRIVVDWDPDF